MSSISVAGIPVDRGKIIFTRSGNWQAKFVMAGEDFPTGKITASFWGETVTGFAFRSAAPYLQAQIYMVGGAGGLSTQTTARDYRYASFAQIVRELLDDAGEVVAEDALIGNEEQLVGWTRANGMVSAELNRLCVGRSDGTTWVVRPSDGQIEVRPPVVTPIAPAVILEADIVTLHKRVYSLDDETAGIVIKPGYQFDSITCDSVEYVIAPDRLRAEVYYGPSQTSPLDRLAELIQLHVDLALARSRAREVDPTAQYFGTVKNVRSNGTVDIKADDPRIGYVNEVPLFTGLPGWQMIPVPSGLTSTGARVLFGWSGGNKELKYALAWGSIPIETLDQTTITAQTLVEWTVPTHRVVGNSEVTQGDDRTEHDVGIGPEFVVTDARIGVAAGPSGLITDLTGTDCAFALTIQADTATTPPPTGGDAAFVTFKREFGKSPRGPVVSGSDSASAALGPYVFASSGECVIGVSKGMAKGETYNFSVLIKE